MNMPKRVELYGSRLCPYTRELREHLEWCGQPFIEYDVEADAAAFERLRTLTGNRRGVPVLVENGIVKTIGWLGRVCFLDNGRSATTP
jgi:mycoredoxin